MKEVNMKVYDSGGVGLRIGDEPMQRFKSIGDALGEIERRLLKHGEHK